MGTNVEGAQFQAKGAEMASEKTMEEFADSLIKLSDEKPLEKISVSDIINDTGRNRKTFYYHFTDKSHLIMWIFRRDLARELEDHFDGEQLVFEDASSDPCSDFPYYTFIKRGVRSIDGSSFFEALASCLENRRVFYSRALRMKDTGNLQDYLYRLYVPAVRSDIDFVLSNRQLKEASADFLSEFYAGAFLSYITRRICSPGNKHVMEGVGPFANIVHSSLENEIKEQQLRRML